MAVTLLNNPTPFRPAHNLQIVATELVEWIRPIWRVATGAQGRSDRRYSQNVREHEQRIVVQTTESKQKLDQASAKLAEANAKIVLLQNRVDELNRQERATRQVSNTALINAMAPQSSPGRGRGSPARGRARGAGTPIRLREEAPPSPAQRLVVKFLRLFDHLGFGLTDAALKTEHMYRLLLLA